ncbi:MAG: acid stress-induced BolA-like protein IbaG/YrbA [Granulosicoccus sp.]|jgi:acid stress-induced BolA-like protein IbaG/YrbA
MRMDYFSDLVEQAIAGAQAEITGDGSKFEARVVSDNFEGLSTLKRHKMVYAVLDEHIKSGAIHALTIKAYTQSEAKDA